MISKTKISAEEFEKVSITAEMAEIFKLPRKAVGRWAVISKDYFEYRLRKVREDGYFASDKYGNHQAIPIKIWEKMFGEKRSAKYELSKQSTRKQNWILNLINEFSKIDELENVLKKFGQEKVILQILDNIDNSRVGGKLYSSTTTAIAHWKYKYGRA